VRLKRLSHQMKFGLPQLMMLKTKGIEHVMCVNRQTKGALDYGQQ